MSNTSFMNPGFWNSLICLLLNMTSGNTSCLFTDLVCSIFIQGYLHAKLIEQHGLFYRLVCNGKFVSFWFFAYDHRLWFFIDICMILRRMNISLCSSSSHSDTITASSAYQVIFMAPAPISEFLPRCFIWSIMIAKSKKPLLNYLIRKFSVFSSVMLLKAYVQLWKVQFWMIMTMI